MCGRFTQIATWAEVWAFSQPLTLTLPEEPTEPAYNIAPTQQAWVIASDGKGGAKAGRMRWGLIPHWAKDIKSGLATFNARIETAATKPTFRSSFATRHCLVPASGSYEWVRTGAAKQAWYIHPAGAPLMFFAGLWDRWVSPAGDALLSFSILTEPAEGAIAELHQRRPLVIDRENAQEWLACSVEASLRISGGSAPSLHWHPVGHEVGNSIADGAFLIIDKRGFLRLTPRFDFPSERTIESLNRPGFLGGCFH